MSTAVCTKKIMAVDQMNMIAGLKHNVPSHNIFLVNTSNEKEPDQNNDYVIMCVGNRHQAKFFSDNFLALETDHVVNMFYNMFKESDLVSIVYNRAEDLLTMYNGPSTLATANQNCCAVGTGFKYAMGAMDAGADAIEAIKIASKYDLMTDGKNIEFVDLSKYPYQVETIGRN